MMAFFNCSSPDLPLETVDSVALSRYAGLWYEIARLPNSFQKNCDCTTAEYTEEKNFIRVVNSCYDTLQQEFRSSKGKAFVVKNSGNAKLKVQFFWPFRGDYWIIDLAGDYSYAVVGDASRRYLWILSRSREMEPQLYDEIVERVRQKGFPVEKLIRTSHLCPEK